MNTFQVFLYLVQEKLKEMGILFNVKEIITDFELNIHKSVDEMLPGVSLLGCFFHLVKAFKKKIEQKKMKMEYENNPLFHKFIKQSVALSSLPLEDVETGYNWLKENVSFDDPKIESFKIEFLQYIDTYWLNGCIPPYVWSTWGRKDDWTNNNQEGYNSKMNRELKQQHPSPGILLCFLKQQITSAEYKIAEAKTVIAGPRQLVKHRKQADKRMELKINFQNAKKMDGADIKELVGEFMSIMGHNVITSTMIGRSTDLTESQDPNNIVEVDDDTDVNTSSWQAVEKSATEDLELGENPFKDRRVGVSKQRQEKETAQASQWWRGALCPSCKRGFTARSVKKQCHSCDKYTHAKKQCLTMAEDNSVFICKTCKPSVDTQERRPKTNENLACRKCDFKSAFRYNLKRHIDNVHDGNDLPEETGDLNEEELQVGSEEQVVLDNKHCNPSNITPPRKAELRDILDELNFINLLENFESEGVDLEVLKSMGKDDIKDCLKEVGIKRFGDRHKICERILTEKRKSTTIPVEKEQTNEYLDQMQNTDSLVAVEIDDNVPEELTLEENLTNSSVYNGSESSVADIFDSSDSPDTVVASSCEFCATAKQHECSYCGIPVCNIMCSIQDPTSDNEQHRVHKQGDNRCVRKDPENLIPFSCPKCAEVFKDVSCLTSHMEKHHEEFGKSFPTVSLVSDGSLTDIHETCKQCGKWFENELDVLNHVERVHEYGELFQLYPCEECGMRASDLLELRNHLEEGHQNDSEEISEDETSEFETSEDETSLEALGITQLPIISKRRKQNFSDLLIDDNGSIDIDDDLADVDFGSSSDELLLLEDEEDDTSEITVAEPIVEIARKRKKQPLLEVVSPKRSRKVAKVPEKITKNKKVNLNCEICETTFSRKDNLSRHIRNKH